MLSMLAAGWWPWVGPNVTLREAVGPYWMVLVVAVLVSFAATPIMRRLAFTLNILDIPDDNVKTHRSPTAYLGGLAVLAGFIAAAFVGDQLIVDRVGDPRATKLILGLCGGAIVATIVGLVDDIRDITPLEKLAGQAVCALFLVLAEIRPDLQRIVGPLGTEIDPIVNSVLGYVIVLAFVLGATNSLNLLDGLDGLCSGVTAIIAVGFLILAVHLATWGTDAMLDPVRIVVSLALFGAVSGFLVFNRHPAAIFLGDAGSILLGFAIASLMMLFAMKNPRWWLGSVVLFGLPMLDTTTAIIRRLANKQPLMKADRGHIYDQMIDRGISLRETVRLNYILAAMYVCLGVGTAVLLKFRYAVVIDLIVAIVSILVVWRKGFFKMIGPRTATDRSA